MTLTCQIKPGEVEEHPFSIEAADYEILDLFAAHPKWKWEIEIRRFEERRTVQQNRALFKLAYKEFAKPDAMGDHDLRYIESVLCMEWYQMKGGKVAGAKFHPKEFSTFEFMDFYAWLQQMGAERYGLDIKDPDPVLRKTPLMPGERMREVVEGR